MSDSDKEFQDELDKYLSQIGKQEGNISPDMESIEKKSEGEETQIEDDSKVFDFEQMKDMVLPLEDYIDSESKETHDEKEDNENDEPESKDESENENNEINQDENGEKDDEGEDEGGTIQSILDNDDKELLDVNDPSLYTDDSSDGISFDELSYSEDKGEGESENFGSIEGKKKFEDLNTGGKKKFEPGRLNKNNMMIAVFAFIFVVLAAFVWANRDHEKKKSEKYEEDDYLSIDGYSPDFGDYKSRAYVDVTDEKNAEASEKINEILFTGEKDTYVNPNEAYTPTYTPVQSGNTTVSQATVTDTYKERVESSIRKSINPKDVSYLPVTGTNASPSIPGYNTVSSNLAADYFNQLGNITDALQGTRGVSNTNQSDSLRYSSAGKYNPNAQGGDISFIPENSIYPGTIISAVLVSGINTDYPGTITARVINNVYDSRTGTKLLIPAGSILRGSYSSSSIGISRIQIAWQTLIMNRDGVDFSVNLGSMVGVDAKGYSGIKGSLNEHAFSYLKAAGISCLFTLINSNIFTYSNAQKNRTTQQMIADSQDIGNKLADKILDRALDIQPTVTVKNGTRINVDVDRVLTLYPYDRDLPVQKYIRN